MAENITNSSQLAEKALEGLWNQQHLLIRLMLPRQKSLASYFPRTLGKNGTGQNVLAEGAEQIRTS